jgi:hypothetical protein
LVFRCSGLTSESPDRGVAVGIGLAIALQSLPLAGVLISIPVLRMNTGTTCIHVREQLQ